MLGSTQPIFEIVTGQILLSRRAEFFRLHREVLLSLLADAGIEPVVMLVTEVGSYSKFLDVYRYASLEEYGKRTDAFLQDERVPQYYSEIGTCINGTIQIELALEFPHFRGTQQPT